MILFSLLVNTLLFARMHTVVSILPEKTFVTAIGGDKVDVTLMVLPGNSPHTYEPKPSQMKDIAKAKLYFSIGVEFENVWLTTFKDLNEKMQIIDLSKGIQKQNITTKHPVETTVHHAKDPHIWTSPTNVKQIATHIYDALVLADQENKAYYKVHYETFIKEVEETDKTVRNILSKQPKGTKFMVFHPSWGYFAKAYGLIQLPAELEGKSPKPKELIALIKEAKEEKISAIFTQPEFSDAIAKVLANELHIKVIKVSPLSPHWSENLLNIAHAIAGE